MYNMINRNYVIMKLSCVLMFFCISLLVAAQPKTEIRAVWLTVNYGLDWPAKPFQSEKDIERQQYELNCILDQLEEIHINMVFFQTRIRGDVIYPSKIEPRSEFVKSVYATADYDPLQYAIKACHQRGIECHSWFVVYPLGPETLYRTPSRSFSTLSRNHLVKAYNKNLYLDPGNPQTNVYILSLIKEIVSTYDIDGIHLDYIRYPESPNNFPDNDTYLRYGNGKNKDDWRRENINRLVYAVYDTVKAIKRWVQVSSSVVGMYKEIQGYGQQHWTAYSTVFQDPIDWISKGKHDFIVPLTYFRGNLFSPYVKDWVARISDRYIVPGLGVFRIDQKESRWEPSVLYDQIYSSREAKTQGNAFFRAAYLPIGPNGFGKGLRSRFYSTPALLPPLTWLSRRIPDTPSSISAYTSGPYLRLEWDKAPAKDNQSIFYNLYRSRTFPVNTRDPENLLAVRLTKNYYQIPVDNHVEGGYYYVVTGFDRYHNESDCSKPVYFVTGNFEK